MWPQLLKLLGMGAKEEGAAAKGASWFSKFFMSADEKAAAKLLKQQAKAEKWMKTPMFENLPDAAKGEAAQGIFAEAMKSSTPFVDALKANWGKLALGYGAQEFILHPDTIGKLYHYSDVTGAIGADAQAKDTIFRNGSSASQPITAADAAVEYKANQEQLAKLYATVGGSPVSGTAGSPAYYRSALASTAPVSGQQTGFVGNTAAPYAPRLEVL